MHNPYCNCAAYQSARRLEWAESEPVRFSETEGELVNASPFSELDELELAAELLSISSEEELDMFLGKLIKGAWKGIKKVGRFVGKIAKPLGGVLKGVAKAALPFVGGALGSFIPIPGVGTALGSALGGALSKALELEYGELEQEDQELEMARRFVRIAGTAARQAALTDPNADPHTTAKAAVVAAARQHLPNLPTSIVDGDLPKIRSAGSLLSGRWVRRGQHIILLSA